MAVTAVKGDETLRGRFTRPPAPHKDEDRHFSRGLVMLAALE